MLALCVFFYDKLQQPWSKYLFWKSLLYDWSHSIRSTQEQKWGERAIVRAALRMWLSVVYFPHQAFGFFPVLLFVLKPLSHKVHRMCSACMFTVWFDLACWAPGLVPQQTAKPQRQSFSVPFISRVSECFKAGIVLPLPIPYVGRK